MSLQAYLAFIAACVALALLPGPVVTLLIANGLRHGSRAALTNILGVQAGLLIVIGTVAVGLTSLMATMGYWFDWVRFAGAARPWHIGTLYHRDTTLPPLLLRALRAEDDLVVGDNEPYAVSDLTDYTIPVHGEARGLVNTGIEIRQDLIADHSGQQQWAERLARILTGIEAQLRAEQKI